MFRSLAFFFAPTLIAASFLVAQQAPQPRGSSNLQVLSQAPLEGGFEFGRMDLEIEQDVSRPFVYVARAVAPLGFDVISLADPSHPELLYEWRIEDASLHVGLGGMDNKYFKLNDRYYLIQSFQFAPGGPNLDLGAIVFDVTGLPDTAAVREVGRIRAADTPGGFHNIFAYKHSSGRVLLFATTSGMHANIYDMERFLAGAEDQGLIGQVPWPHTAPIQTAFGPLAGYHDFYVAWDPNTNQDKIYGAGFNGYYIYDVTTPETPSLVTSVVGVLGLDLAHTLSASPDGKIAFGQTEYLYSPVRVFDLEPGLDGTLETINTETGVWTGNWKGMSHNHEMRWPYVFVSHYADGIYVVNIRDPENPTTVARFNTYDGDRKRGLDPRFPDLIGPAGFTGAFGVDVRNADGLIVVSDMATGLWTFKLDGFNGWNGEDFGMPNISSVQDWDSVRRPIVP